MPAEPRGSAHVATEATDTLLCEYRAFEFVYITGLRPNPTRHAREGGRLRDGDVLVKDPGWGPRQSTM